MKGSLRDDFEKTCELGGFTFPWGKVPIAMGG
jgi:hypothetical protein